MIIPNVHNNWDPLKYVILGDVWNSSFYEDIKDGAIRDAFQTVTEWTKEDLNIIQKKLEELGVEVVRPNISSPTVGKTGKLPKPPICPRDSSAVLGNTFYYGEGHHFLYEYQEILSKINRSNIKINGAINFGLSGAGLVKFGKDIIIDKGEGSNEQTTDEAKRRVFEDVYSLEKHKKQYLQEYRIRYTTEGGHTDGCFMPLKPGLLLTSLYYKEYETVAPNWERIDLSTPTYAHHRSQNGLGWKLKTKLEQEKNLEKGYRKWFVSNDNGTVDYYPAINDFVEKYCADWIGDYTETFFEVNTLVIDEKNLLCMGIHESLFRDLERHGITPHVVPFRCRTFWDGGLHCITLDLVREGSLKEYDYGRDTSHELLVSSKHFDYSDGQFKKEYNEFKAQREQQ